MNFKINLLGSILTLGTLLTSFTASSNVNGSISTEGFKNILRPFSTDGCSRFPDGIPFIKPNLWLNCCIEHDVSYWQGGTALQRSNADAALAKCVNDATGTALGNDMWIGVRLGGFVGLPTSWHWGYGWVMDRGYAELNISEQVQLDFHKRSIPTDYSTLTIEDSYLIRERQSVTGSHCLDQALRLIHNDLKKPFKIRRLFTTKFVKSGFDYERIEVTLDECIDPYKIEFQLLNSNACTRQQNEIKARGQIRLREVYRPSANSCAFK